MSTSIEETLVPKLRRAIGDVEFPYAYGDSILSEYIADSIESIQLIWRHDYTVDREIMEVTPEVDTTIQHLFILNAQVEMVENRPNLNFSVGSLSVRRVSHADAKASLNSKLERAIAQIHMLEGLGKSSTEYDLYKNRLEDWLKYTLY